MSHLWQICDENIFPSNFVQFFTTQKWNFQILIKIKQKLGLYFQKNWNFLFSLLNPQCNEVELQEFILLIKTVPGSISGTLGHWGAVTLHWGIAFPQCCKFIKVSIHRCPLAWHRGRSWFGGWGQWWWWRGTSTCHDRAVVGKSALCQANSSNNTNWANLTRFFSTNNSAFPAPLHLITPDFDSITCLLVSADSGIKCGLTTLRSKLKPSIILLGSRWAQSCPSSCFKVDATCPTFYLPVYSPQNLTFVNISLQSKQCL